MSDTIDSNEYLDSSFDPQSLKVAELRRIFLEHNVYFKSSAKKSELVMVFNEEIKPRAGELLRAKREPVRSSNKIETVGNASPVVLPTTTPKRGPGRPRKHPLPDDEAPTTTKKEPTTAKKDSEPATARKSVGRPRKAPKLESDEDTKKSSRRKTATFAASRSDDEMDVEDEKPESRTISSTFSSLNPFQSASPPATAGGRRRQTAVPTSSQKLAPPSSKASRRKTDIALTPTSISSKAGTNDVEFTFTRPDKTPKSNPFKKAERFMPPISSLKASPAFQSAAQRRKENDLASRQIAGSQQEEAGEEFTEEETATLPRRRLVRKTQQTSPINQFLKWASLLGLTAGSAYGANWYRNEKLKAGYCGIDSRPVVTPPHANDLEKLVHYIRPQCVPCPPHAICSPGFKMRCEEEFVKIDHPLSLSGLVPISAECAPDTGKLRKIQIVADEIIETLRDRTASVECGYTTAPTDRETGMSTAEIKEALLAKKSPSITPEQFDTLFTHAIDEIKTREEIEISSSKPTQEPTYEGLGHVDLHITHYYHSTSLANINLKCRIRRDFLSVLARYRVELIGLLTSGALALYLKNFFQSRGIQKQRVQALVSRVYDELSTARARAKDQPKKYEPHLGVSQLRDSLLADEFSYSQRERLWHDVQSVVESNSNVRATQAEIQGEWLRAWEWVGAVRDLTLEDRRRSQGLSGSDEFVRPIV